MAASAPPVGSPLRDERALLLDSLVAEAPVGMFMKDREGRYLVANEIAARAIGLRPDEVVGRRDDEILPPELARQIVEHDRAVVTSGGPVTYDETLPGPGGPRLWVRSAWPVRDAEGRIAGLAGVVRDVTERRRVEAEAQAASARAEQAASRLAALELVTESALALLSGEDLIRELLDRVRRLFVTDTTTLLLLRPDGQALQVSAAVGLEEEVVQKIEIPVGRGFAGTIATTWQPLVLKDISHHEIISPVLKQAGVRSMLGVPLLVRDRLLGVLHVATLTQRDFGPDEVRLLEVVAGRVASALENVRLLRAEREARAVSEAAEQRYRVLVNGLDRSIVWEADASTLWFSFVSLPAEKLLGFPLSDWFTRPSFFTQRLHPDDRERVLGELRAAAADEQARKFDHRLVKADGAPVWVQTGVTVTRRGDAKLFHGISMDIDDLKQADENLRARVRQQGVTAELGQRALGGADVAALLDEAAARVARAQGVELVEILELMPGRDRFLLRAGVGWEEGLVGHATEGGAGDSQVGYTRSAGLPVIVEDLRTETRFRPSSLLLGHGVVSGLSVVIPGTGEPFGVLSAHMRTPRAFGAEDVAFLQSIANLLATAIVHAQTIGELDAARARAEAAERRLAALYQATGVLLAGLPDVEDCVTRFVGQVVSALADLGCIHFVDEPDVRRVVFRLDPDESAVALPSEESRDLPESIADAIRMGEARLFPDPAAALVAACQALYHDPARRPTSAVVAPLRARGRTYGAVAFVALEPRRYGRDDLAIVEEVAYRAALVLDNAHLAEETERVVREREQLVAVVAHDLRNAVNAVTLSAGALARASLDEHARRNVTRIVAVSDTMGRLMQSVLDVGALEGGRLNVHPGTCDPSEIVRETVEIMVPLADARRIRLDADVPQGLPPVVCDRNRIAQVLSNLIGNALKFVKQGRVRVSARRGDGEVVFAVEDSGPGIRPEDLQRVFDRFWQARETARQGTGLGLFLVKGIVEVHRGRVWAESGVGEGATFFFTLPIAGGDTPSRETSSQAA